MTPNGNPIWSARRFILLCSLPIAVPFIFAQERPQKCVLDESIDVAVSGKPLTATLSELSKRSHLRIIAEVNTDANTMPIVLTQGKQTIGKVTSDIAARIKGVRLERDGVVLIQKDFANSVDPPARKLIQNSEGLITCLEQLPATVRESLSEQTVLQVHKLPPEQQERILSFLSLREGDQETKEPKQKSTPPRPQSEVRFVYDPYLEVLSESGAVERRLFIRSGPHLLDLFERAQQDPKRTRRPSTRGE